MLRNEEKGFHEEEQRETLMMASDAKRIGGYDIFEQINMLTVLYLGIFIQSKR